MRKYLPMFKRRTRAFLTLLALLTLLLIVRAAILTIGPDNRLQSNLAVMNRSPHSFLALGTQIETLQRMTSNIDSYNLGEIKNALATTAALAGHARTEFQAQYDAWLDVQGKSSKDKESFLNLRQRLDEVQRLQDGEIVRLKKLLDESAKPTLFADGLNLLISFVLGVLSSILASHLYEWRKQKKANQPAKEL